MHLHGLIGIAMSDQINGPLLHGWLYDIYSFADVTPLPTAAGYRVIFAGSSGAGFLRRSRNPQAPPWQRLMLHFVLRVASPYSHHPANMAGKK
jgi:hypothetical protein